VKNTTVKTRGSVGWACVAHLSFRFEQTLYWTFHRCFIPNFDSFGHTVSEEKIFFLNQPFRNKNCLWWPCFLTDRFEISNLYRGSSIDASYQISVHWTTWFQRGRFFRNLPIRYNNCLWSPCLFTNWAEISILYRGPLIDASSQLSDHLAKWFQRTRFFRNQPIRNKHYQ